MRLIPAHACQRQRWKNDGGWTTEIARDADPAAAPGDFRWRVSIAEIEQDGPFSTFPGIARDLILLEGAGMELAVGTENPVRLARRFDRIHFDGALPVSCRLLDGPTRDFNVMVHRDAVHAEVLVRPLAATMLIPPATQAEWLIHVLSGRAAAKQGDQELELASGDSLHLERAGSRVLLEGAGELVMVRFGKAASLDDLENP
ncbi:MAG: HutD family protein [Xanthomonadales bacterium]|nr:HutD family protein [Xanthomonadales bacterium]